MRWTKKWGARQSTIMKPFIPSDPDPAPMRRLARKYSLLDARALIAATAAGLTIDRVFWSDMHGRDGAVLKHCRELTAAGVIRGADSRARDDAGSWNE
jgi:uncharacterized protein (DUF1800 family)